DLYQAIYQKVGLSRTQSAALVELVLKEITDCLERGETVQLSSFGLFVVRKKGQRMGRNPKTGEEAPISPRRVVVFKPFRGPQAADQCASFAISMRAPDRSMWRSTSSNQPPPRISDKARSRRGRCRGNPRSFDAIASARQRQSDLQRIKSAQPNPGFRPPIMTSYQSGL